MVYVQDINGSPLMPTVRHGKVRRLLKNKQAKVVKRCPFTIQLLYKSTTYTQTVTLGIDAGSKTVGLSAVTDKKELYASETTLRNDIVELLSSRRSLRRGRRFRKTRYRAARFNNRKKVKKWLAPSIRHKIGSHLRLIKEIHKILPIEKIIIETASFDIQKIKNPDISGTDYQNGEQTGFWNVREYVLFRDGHTCACCHGKSKDSVLTVHHIESRQTGGDAPGNLITLCKTCHTNLHAGKIRLDLKRKPSFKDAAFMGIMRQTVYRELKGLYPDVKMTYGYITKQTRITHNLDKTHAIDARCITGHPDVMPADVIYVQKFVRRNNRSLHKMNFKKGIRKSNQAAKYIHGFMLFDKVLYQKIPCFIFGRRKNGYFDLRNLTGKKIHASASYKKLYLLEKRKTLLCERRTRIPLTA